MKWKNISIFISSTFNDMQSERDYIRKFIIPRLNEELYKYQINVQVTDLRWGINTHEVNEAERESKVLHVCIDSIKNTRPYFIALLGERYGWTPSETRINQIKQSLNDKERAFVEDVTENLSVTELEIILGAIGSPEMLEHSYFCFRTPSSYDNIPYEEASRYMDVFNDTTEGKKNAQKLTKLKNNINRICADNNCSERIIHYNAYWDEKENKFSKLQDLGEQLYDRLLNDIMDYYESNHEEDSSIVEEQKLLESFISVNVENFLGRKELLEKLSQFILDNRSASSILKGVNGIILSGDSGSGKSYIFSALYDMLNKLSDEYSLFILPHAAGISPQSVKVKEMIRNWSFIIKSFLSEDLDNVEVNTESFKQLLFKVQAKGYFPVILIDSLDSFMPEDIFMPKDIFEIFKYIPYNIPFVCTSLPVYAKSIIKKHGNYRLMNIGSFSLEDALLVIESSLRKNYKELSDNLKKEIINITSDNGTPAYTSPFWIKMCMSILMELGAEDFQKIHKEQYENEDMKIEAYLQKTIKSLPATPDKLFEYFLLLTSHYFDTEITMRSLTFIAISQYGVNESVLSDLIGDKWNQLEFTSLRYWLRDFIRHYGNSDKWTFTHAILKNILLHQNEKFVDECKNVLVDYLIKKSVNGIEEDELISQIVNGLDCEIFHKYILKKENDYYSVVNAIMRFSSDNKQQTIDFLDKYLSYYYTERNEWIEYLVYGLKSEFDLSDTDEEQIEYLCNLCRLPYKYFKHDDIFGGDSEILSNYFYAHLHIFELYEYYDKFSELTEELFLKIKGEYLINKELYDKKILKRDYIHYFYSYWKKYTSILYRKGKYDDSYKELYKQNFEELLSEVEWFADNIYDYYGKYNIYYYIFNLYFGKFNYCLTREELIEYAKRIHIDFLKLEPDDYDEGFDERAYEMIQQYIKIFGDEQITPTPLLERYNVRNSQTHKDDDSKPLTDIGLDDDKIIGSISIINDEDEDLNPDEWHEINLEEFFSDVEDEEKVKEENEENNTEIPTTDEIENAKNELNSYISKNPLDEISDEQSYEVLENYYNKMKTVADLYFRSGNRDESLKLMKIAETLIIKVIYDMGNNYAIKEYELDNIIDLANWYAKRNCVQEQIDLLEATCFALMNSYYHHIDGYAQKSMLHKLITVYDMYGMIDKKINLQETMFEFCFRYQVEHNFKHYYEDLSYVRPVFESLFNTLKKANKTEKAVILLERWIELCDMTYIDDKDTGYGYDDYDETYDRLAGLYDGTPAIVKGMKERNSVFLSDPYIMVCHDGKWGYIDHDGKVCIPCIYERGWRADGELISVRKNGKWGYLSMDGKVVIDFMLDVATPPHKGYAQIMANNNSAIYKYDGIVPIETECERYYSFADGLLKVLLKTRKGYRKDFLKDDGATLLFNGVMNEVYTPNHGVIVTHRYEDGAHISGLYDYDGNSLLPESKVYKYIVPFGNNKLTIATTEHLSGFIDRYGREIIPLKYNDVRPYHEGLAAVSLSGKNIYSGYWGFIDETGKEILPIKYNDVGNFHEGLAWVCKANDDKGFGFKGGKFGFIDKKGNVVIPFMYDDVSSFWHGKALVFLNNRFFYINKNGEQIK